MSNRIQQLLLQKKQHILSIYFTAGYPQLDDTVSIIKELDVAGVDMIEIGFPFSDPLADGPVIQQSSAIALQNGMTIKKLFEQLKDCRNTFHLPLILMGYLNPIMQYGIKKFCEDAKAVGVDGIILPDLPIYEYENEYRQYFTENNQTIVTLATKK